MRIPVSNVCRAFPELDRFSDHQCRAYARSVLQLRRPVWLFMTLGRWTIAITLSIALFAASLWLLSVCVSDIDAHMMLVPVGLATSILLGWLASISIRDRWLRRAIAKHLRTSRCPSCGYQLLGLPISDGAVRCPECGDTLRLADLGLTPEQLMSQVPGAAP